MERDEVAAATRSTTNGEPRTARLKKELLLQLTLRAVLPGSAELIRSTADLQYVLVEVSNLLTSRFEFSDCAMQVNNCPIGLPGPTGQRGGDGGKAGFDFTFF